jgi:hypothetical protein
MKVGPLILALCAALAPATSTRAAEAWTDSHVTQIRRLVNTGTIQIGRKSERRTQVKDRVAPSEYVLTGTGALAELQFNDRSILRVGQNTVFTYAPGSRNARLDQGSVLYHDLDADAQTEVRTPLLTCAIEGCLFVVQTFGPIGAFYLFDGDATVNGRKLKPGDCLIVDRGNVRVFRFDRLLALRTGALFVQFPELPIARRLLAQIPSDPSLVNPPGHSRFSDTLIEPPGPDPKPRPKRDKPRQERQIPDDEGPYDDSPR